MKVVGGFSLIELAMVIFIISLVLSNLLMPLASQLNIQRAQLTEQRLEDIKEALLGFVIINRRLPCPDTQYPKLPDGSEFPDGLEDPEGTSCKALEGWLPWATLSTWQYDAWGQIFRYRVANAYSDLINPQSSSELVIIDVHQSSGNPYQFTNNTDTKVAAIIFSFGKNRKADGENASNPPNEIYIKNSRGLIDVENPDTDDIVTWLSAYTVANRLIKVGKWPL